MTPARPRILPLKVDKGPSPGHRSARGLRAAERFFNRDLSWLAFNDRVLSEASNPAVPALERLRFCTIVSSNLDEFFMVRVAEIAQLARRGNVRFPDGLTARQVLAQVREHALRQKSRQAVVFREIVAALKAEGIELLAEFPPDSATDAEIQQRLPRLRTLVRRHPEPPPALLSERLHVFVRFPREYAIVTIEDREGRLVALPDREGARRYALLERWIAARASELFPGREVIEAFPFKIIRNADLRWRPDDESTLEEQILEAVQHRVRAKVVRLEVDSPSYFEGALFLGSALRLDSSALYRFDLPLDLRGLARIEPPKPGLRYPPVEPQVPPPLRDPDSILRVMGEHDILLHHPYDSFDPVVRFLELAARDPAVRRVYHTLYRTSHDSPVMAALKAAAASGKKVTAYVEIKARFDELNNLRWAAELRKAGVRVVRHLGRYKVHSKATLIVREEEGRERVYAHLGTGNYHPVTAKQYTDLSLLTADEPLGRELLTYFEALIRGRQPERLRELMVAPFSLHEQVLRLIREERRLHREGGGRGRIIAKLNSLVDPEIIEALYDASNAGVRVDLLVRGICCLRPDIAGMSQNIRVLSVIDRFLEHSRIYYFRAGGARRVYLSSADWMPRNFYSRYELAFPVKDPALKRYIKDTILAQGLADNQKAWQLKPDGAYARVQPAPNASLIRSQTYFEALARSDYRGTVLEPRIPSAPPSAAVGPKS